VFDPGVPDAAQDLAADDPDLLKVRQLRVGVWLEFLEPEKTALRGKLNAIMAPADRYVFVNRAGLKVLERSAGQLALAFKRGALRILDEALLFERALATVAGNLRQLNRGK